ncbi:hypothetical protein YC2023_115016 [Brassica napus]
MAFYVMPDEFYRIGVLDSTLSDQGDLMELSSYAVVLASTASPSSPNSFLLVALEIHLVSPGSLIGVRADLTCVMGCLAKSRSSLGNFPTSKPYRYGLLKLDLGFRALERRIRTLSKIDLESLWIRTINIALHLWVDIVALRDSLSISNFGAVAGSSFLSPSSVKSSD